MFYLTLPSNSSASYYEDNTVTNYKTKLCKPINLQGEWEVGLAEIQYPHTWYNMKAGDGVMHIKTSSRGPVYRTELKPGLYSSPRKLVRALNGLNDMLPDSRNVLFYYDDITRKVAIDIAEGASVTLSEGLMQLLGMARQDYEEGSHDGERVVDVHQGFYSLYVYCNLAKPCPVGDTEVPLLRIVPVEGKDGEMVTKTYQTIQYVPMCLQSFETVEVDIRKDTGAKVPFERGKLVVTLHLRRRRTL